MDMILKFLNLLTLPLTIFNIFIFFPFFLFLKFFFSILRSFFRQNVTGKVVLITGASSGIGEHLAYEYARRGALLALTARRENRLQEVAKRALELGSPKAIAIGADVANVDDCRRIVDQTIDHFGQLDHLVNNAGIASVSSFEDIETITDFRPIMDINFWGSIYTTRFAAPHLRKSNGRIIVVSSIASWLPLPRMGFYNASKAAMAHFFDTLRIEFEPDVKITIVTPGIVESEITQGKLLKQGGKMEVDEATRDAQISILPVGRADKLAKDIINSTCRGDRYLTEPAWYRATFLWNLFYPEVLEWIARLLYIPRQGASPISKTILDFSGAKNILYPKSIRKPHKKQT